MSDLADLPETDGFEPVSDFTGVTRIPLTGGSWELMICEDGILHLACASIDLVTGLTARYIVDIGVPLDETPEELIESVNMIRNQGASLSAPN